MVSTMWQNKDVQNYMQNCFGLSYSEAVNMKNFLLEEGKLLSKKLSDCEVDI